jgi:PAS domain S-box-containing protein
VRDYAIFMLDPSGRIATWNPGAQHLKGYDAEEIIGRSFAIFYTAEDRERQHPTFELETATRDGRYEEEGWRVRKDGTRFWANVVITAVRDDAGELIGFAKVTRDLTESRAAEQALRTANVELDRFASVAAHDLSDPLRTIAGFADLLTREPLEERGREYLGFITSTATRMQALLSSLLTYARAGESAAPAEGVRLRDAADRVLSSLAIAVQERGAEVVVALPEDAVVAASAADVEIVLQNLVSNALKFGDPVRPRIEIAAERQGEAWRITVADNGVGIAPADQQRIFDAFERAHAELGRDGSGLGLAICERLVRRGGGSMGVDSALGQGSRFWVLLPPVATA